MSQDNSPIKDKEQSPTIHDLMKGINEVRRQDIIAFAMKLLDKTSLWYHTNIKNARDFERILAARTWADIHKQTFNVFDNVPSTELSDEKKQIIKDYVNSINQTVLNVTENYAELRKSTKGLTAKQIERIATNTKSDDPKKLDKLFKGKEKPQ